MWFLLLGLLGLALKYFQIGPFAAWSWWIFAIPFVLTVLWWAWADRFGYTERKEMRKMELRKKDRQQKQREALGMTKKRR